MEKMPVAELREALADLYPNIPVLLAMQPAWSMHYDVRHAVTVDGAIYLTGQSQNRVT